MANGVIKYRYPAEPRVTIQPKFAYPRSTFPTGFKGHRVRPFHGARNISVVPVLGHAAQHNLAHHKIPGTITTRIVGQPRKRRR